MKWKWSYLINPLGAIADVINDSRGVTPEADAYRREHNGSLEGYQDAGTVIKNKWNQFTNWLGGIWNDYTGQTAIDKQNEANMDLAKYQADMQEEFYNKYSSPQAVMRQNQEAGLNPNLIYGSASSGQGNVPSFNAPSFQRGLSKFEQLQKGLALLTGVMNVQNLMYNTMASREIAEQNGVKTLGLLEDVLSKRRNNAVNSSMVGYSPSIGIDRLFNKSVLGRQKYGVDVYQGLSSLDHYSQTMRNLKFNQALKAMMYNAYEYGNYIDFNGDQQSYKPTEDWYSNGIWRNAVLKFDAKSRQFNYEWDNDYKTLMKSMGVASPIVQVLLKLLGGSK